MIEIPFVYKEGKVFLYHMAKSGEIQEYCDRSVLIHGVDPDKYIYTDGAVTPVSREVADQLDLATNGVLQAEEARLISITAARESSEFKEVTVEVAAAFINTMFDIPTDDLDSGLPSLQDAASFEEFKQPVISALIELRNLLVTLRDNSKNTHDEEIPYLLK